MLIHTLLKRGTIHKDFCEDFLLDFHLNKQYYLGAIFDGCSTGKDSHFASTLWSKIFIKSCENTDFNSGIEELHKSILYKSIIKLNEIKKLLSLNTNELLSTIIFMLIDKIENKARIIVIGDGFLNINGKKYDVDQSNTPDYLSYHISKLLNYDDFDKWYTKFENKFDIPEIENLSIASDGILKFKRYGSENEINDKDFSEISFLVDDNYLINNKAMLSRKFNILKNKKKSETFDDLAIIRITKTKI